MQAAQADIDREMQQAEVDGVDEGEKVKRINKIFAAKNVRAKQMNNAHGAVSSKAKECYSKCADMSEMRSKYSAPAAASTSMAAAEMNYDLNEDEAVNEEQSSRIFQKWAHRKK